MKVEQVMNRPVVTCLPSDPLHAAAGLMWEPDCGVIPIVDDDGKLVGIVTDRDICMAGMMDGRPLSAIPAPAPRKPAPPRSRRRRGAPDPSPS